MNSESVIRCIILLNASNVSDAVLTVFRRGRCFLSFNRTLIFSSVSWTIPASHFRCWFDKQSLSEYWGQLFISTASERVWMSWCDSVCHTPPLSVSAVTSASPATSSPGLEVWPVSAGWNQAVWSLKPPVHTEHTLSLKDQKNHSIQSWDSEIKMFKAVLKSEISEIYLSNPKHSSQFKMDDQKLFSWEQNEINIFTKILYQVLRTYTVNEHTSQKANNSLKMFFYWSWNWWVFVKCEPKSSQLK